MKVGSSGLTTSHPSLRFHEFGENRTGTPTRSIIQNHNILALKNLRRNIRITQIPTDIEPAPKRLDRHIRKVIPQFRREIIAINHIRGIRLAPRRERLTVPVYIRLDLILGIDRVVVAGDVSFAEEGAEVVDHRGRAKTCGAEGINGGEELFEGVEAAKDFAAAVGLEVDD
jgi:hypothetical protein